MEKNAEEADGAQEYQVDQNQEIPDTGDKLNSKKLKDLMVQLNEQMDKGEVDIMVFTEVYIEWTKMFHHLGKALVVAF
jgi:hypothetical protein